MNAQTIVEIVGPTQTSCGFDHWVCPRDPFCSQYTLIKETEITGEICFNIHHHHDHHSNRPRYSCCIFHLPRLQLRLYNQCGICIALCIFQYMERNVKMLFYFSFFVKNIRECHQHPTHRLCSSSGAINLKLLKFSKIV